MIWLDLETTGLNPNEDHILELAAYNDETGSHFERVWHFPEDQIHTLDPFIQNMHRENDLLRECALSKEGWITVEQDLAAWLPPGDGHTLAGSSVHFDLGFLKIDLPVIAKRFSHKLFDVSAIKLFCQELGMPPIPKANAHRAAEDIAESREHLAMCRNWVRQ